MNDLPIVDITALDSLQLPCEASSGQSQNTSARRTAVAALAKAFHEIGFVGISGHGIPPATIAALREQTIKLFSRPIAEKSNLLVEPLNYRGYVPLGFFTPNAAGKDADQYEAYKLHFEIHPSHPICSLSALYGPNKWPQNSAALQSAVSNYWRECDRVTILLLDAIADFLDIPRSIFSAAFENPLTNMTLLHYPAQTQGGFGIHPHKDTDALTILAADPIGGLFLRPRNAADWISADAPADVLIVNIGDMLEIWSGGYFVSTPHKVITPLGMERYSFPYFAVPRFDVQVKALDTRVVDASSACGNPDSRIMQAGEVSAKIWQSNWPDADAIEQCYDPYTP